MLVSRDGHAQGDLRSPHPLFSVEYYLLKRPDVRDAGVDPLIHFMTYGWKEGSDPSPFFDVSFYQSQKPPLEGMDPLTHYVVSGSKMGYWPNKDFDPQWYSLTYSDVRDSGLEPLVHFVLIGQALGRSTRSEGESPNIEAIPSDFDPAIYLELNPDVASAKANPTRHYIDLGRSEGRQYRPDPAEMITGIELPKRKSFFSSFVGGNLSVNPKVVAFYLPQYHRIKENDDWWGEGFTEWVNVRKARPNYIGHHQPHVPQNEYYYDLSNIDVQKSQAILAREYGVTAFCYYMYWFNGRRVLERPLDQMLHTPAIDMEFCICWANENWTRTWDGKANDVLLRQTHSLEGDRQFILDAMKYLADPRYMRVDGRLVLLVYRTDLISDCAAVSRMWREEVRRAGLGELHLCAVQFYGVTDPEPWGFDAAVEFPPHGWLVSENQPDNPPTILNPYFNGCIFDYSKAVDFALRKPIPDYRWYRGVFPGWDNTARRQNTSHIFANSNVIDFERWLTELLRQTVINAPPEHQIIFINAWNEWGEGAHLEPDARSGRQYLHAVQSALFRTRHEDGPLSILSRLRNCGAYPERDKDERTLLNLLKGQEQTLRHLAMQLHAAAGSSNK